MTYDSVSHKSSSKTLDYMNAPASCHYITELVRLQTKRRLFEAWLLLTPSGPPEVASQIAGLLSALAVRMLSAKLHKRTWSSQQFLQHSEGGSLCFARATSCTLPPSGGVDGP